MSSSNVGHLTKRTPIAGGRSRGRGTAGHRGFGSQVVVDDHSGRVLLEPDLRGADHIPGHRPADPFAASIHVDLQAQIRPPAGPAKGNFAGDDSPINPDERLIDNVDARLIGQGGPLQNTPWRFGLSLVAHARSVPRASGFCS